MAASAGRKRRSQQAVENGSPKNSSEKQKPGKRQERGRPWRSSGAVLQGALVLTLAVASGILYRKHVIEMFENDKHFSHLSTLERELSFRTEMTSWAQISRFPNIQSVMDDDEFCTSELLCKGLYYSYYKTMVESPSLADGVAQIMADNVTEYPEIINTLKRFNLYPEIMLAIAYRSYDAINKQLNRQTKVCWKVNRGELLPVESCEGLGEPAYFYIEIVFGLHGVMMTIFFLFGVYLSGSVFGGILAVTSYFYNQGECSRVQWTPPLRESFAYPFFVMEMFLVTHVLRVQRPMLRHAAWIGMATTCFMLPWQFSQFTLMTQTVSVFATYVLRFIGSSKLKYILAGQTIGLLMSYALLFGNEMLLASYYCSCLITVWVIVFLEPLLEILRIRILIWLAQGSCLLSGTVLFKLLLGKLLKMADDAHIGDILRSKFTNFKNFHTMLYTCAEEFDFMQKVTPLKLLQTLLIPGTIVVIIVILVMVAGNEWASWKQKKKPKGKVDNGMETCLRSYRSKPYAEFVYHIFQLVAFTVMAVLIMRLKLFWTPHLCLMVSVLASRKFFGWLGSHEKHLAVLALIFAAMTYKGWQNISHQRNISGEFSNYPQEELIEWIKKATPLNAVFAGSMPIMATVKLCTKRPIVNHPHYEDSGLRARTMKVYMLYSRKPASEVYHNLLDLKVDYAILEASWCHKKVRPSCSMAEIWDIEDKVNREEQTVCDKLTNKPEPYFEIVFRNGVYAVLKLK